MSDLNIPDEVIEATAHAIIDADYPGIGWRTVHGEARERRLRQARAAAQVIARWAYVKGLTDAESVAAPFQIGGEVSHAILALSDPYN